MTYRPYPVECLPNPLKDLVIHGTASIGTDEANIAVQGWGHAAGMVNKARAVQIDSDWKVYCVFWVLSCGYSGAGKSRGWELSHNAAWDLHKERRARDSNRDLVITDANSAALKQVLRKNPRGVLQSAMRHPHSWVV